METELRYIDAISAHEILQGNPAVRAVDIRAVAEYDRGHIPRAINLAWRMIDGLNTLGWDTAAECLVIGSGVGDSEVAHAVRALSALGFRSVCLRGGMESWLGMGLPVGQSSSRGKFCCGRGCGCE